MLDKKRIQDAMKLLHTRLKKKGLKTTRQRDEIAEFIFNQQGHFNIEELIDLFKATGKKVSTATTYRVIQMLVDLELVNELDFGTGSKYYEHDLNQQHHDHLICDSCGIIIEFYDVKLEKLKEKIADDHKFKMKSHSLHIFGICSKCQS